MPSSSSRVVGQPDAVGVDHHDVDRLRGGVIEDAEELGVDRRLAARELQHLGAALDRDQPVDRPRRIRRSSGACRPARWRRSTSGTAGCTTT